MTDQRRYTGPELSALLEQVRRELGSDASILEANKIRSGGLGGFFTTESFEVVAAPDGASAKVDERYVIAMPDVAADLDDSPPEPTFVEEIDRSPSPRRRIPNGLLERAEAISVQERIELSRPPSKGRATEPQKSFAQILDDELEEDATLSEPIATTGMETAAATLEESTAPTLEESTAPTLEEPTAPTLKEPTATAHPEEFWAQLDSFDRSLPTIDSTSQIITIIGGLSSALSVADRLEHNETTAPRSLVVVSGCRDHEVDVLPWQLARSSEELNDRLALWKASDRKGIVVIDSSFVAQARRCIEVAQLAGSNVMRLAIDDVLPPTRIFSIMQRFGGDVVIDLSYQADPVYLLDLLDCGVPVASVGGRSVDAGLLLAMSTNAGHG
jgi:hypothetical protein